MWSCFLHKSTLIIAKPGDFQHPNFSSIDVNCIPSASRPNSLKRKTSRLFSYTNRDILWFKFTSLLIQTILQHNKIAMWSSKTTIHKFNKWSCLPQCIYYNKLIGRFIYECPQKCSLTFLVFIWTTFRVLITTSCKVVIYMMHCVF